MYDVPLSVGWIFDRCLELQPFVGPVLVLIVIFAGLLAMALSWMAKRLKVSLAFKWFIASIPIILVDLGFAYLFLNSLYADGPTGIGVFVVILVLLLCHVMWYHLMKFHFSSPKKQRKDTAKTIIMSFLVSTVLLAPVALLALIAGFIICLQTSFIPPLDAAHPIHAIIKEQFKEGVSVPRTLEDVEKINPERYKVLSERAKLQYVFDEEKNSYTFFARPSLHYVYVFDNTRDIVIYKLDNGSYPYDSEQTKLFPPTYPGPWDQLPK